MIISLLKNHSYKLAIAWALVIFGLCSMPGRFIPSVTWLELLSFDKWVHAGVFFILVSLLGISVNIHQQNKNLFYLYFLLSVMYGGLLEIMQAKVFSERSADWFDMIANSFGCLMALLLNRKITRWIIK
ncbi:MAG TPA: VanZ family protein [Bacteroidia bacterium]|nr:VanZ family protein [Bacteroidia bacterium]